MAQRNKIQLYVQLLGCILIATGVEMMQGKGKRFLEFVNIIFLPLY